MEKNLATFEWPSDPPKALPVDYTIREFAELMGETPRKVHDNLVVHPLLKRCFQASRPDRPAFSKSEQILPLPIEASPFLESFFHVGLDRRYRKKLLKDEISEELLEEFMRELCRDLCQRTLPLNAPVKQNNRTALNATNDNGAASVDPTAFCRHVLFQNTTFSEIIMDELLEREMKKRYTVLVQRNKSVRSKTKVAMLEKCLLALDQVLIEFEPAKKTAVKQFYKTESLQKMLAELLRARKKTPDGKCFVVRNPKITEGNIRNLREGFAKINNYRQKGSEYDSLRKIVRNKYLSDLATTVKTSKFEKDYLRLNDYLNMHNLQGVEDLFIKEIKIACTKILEYCHNIQTPDRCTEPKASKRYIDKLTVDVANSELRTAGRIFQDTFDMVRYYHNSSLIYHNAIVQTWAADVSLLPQILSIVKKYMPIEEEMEREIKKLINESTESLKNGEIWNQAPRSSGYNYFYYDACEFSEYFQTAWSFLQGDTTPIFYENHFLVNRGHLAELFWEQSKRAATFFDCLNYFPYTAKDIADKLFSYEKIVKFPDYLAPYGVMLDFVPAILTGLILQLLMRIASDSLSRKKKQAKLLAFLRDFPI